MHDESPEQRRERLDGFTIVIADTDAARRADERTTEMLGPPLLIEVTRGKG